MKFNRELTSDIFWSFVAVLIIAAGIVGFRIMGAMQKPVQAASIERAVAVVDTERLVSYAKPVPVTGAGFISPVRQVALAALASGRITELHTALIHSGYVKEGAVLVQLDDRAARSELSRTSSEIASTQARLSLNATQLERSRSLRRRGVISQDELDQLEARQTELEAALASAESARDYAQIRLDDMRVLAPFDARVMSRHVEVGDVIASGSVLAELYSDDNLEVTVPLTENEALLIPGLLASDQTADSDKSGFTSNAIVAVDFGGESYTWSATVSRVAGILDRQSRLLDVTVTLDRQRSKDSIALVNSYASVTIEGLTDPSVLRIAASALREGDTIWLALNGALVIQDVSVLQIDQGEAYVRTLGSVENNARLITSTLDVPVNGMAVQDSSPDMFNTLTLNQ